MKPLRNRRTGAIHLRRAGVVLLVAAFGATLAVPILLGGRVALAAVVGFPVAGYLALLGVIATSWLARAVKIRTLLHRLGVVAPFAQLLAISLATDCAFMVTPAGVGGYAASVYYLHRAGASVSGATTITAADQALDVIFFLLAVPLAAFTLFGAHLPSRWAIVAIGGGGLVLALVFAALFARRRLLAWMLGQDGAGARWPWWQRHRQALRGFCSNLVAHARMLAAAGPWFFGAVFGLTAVQWLARYGVLWLALAVLGHPISVAKAFLLQSIVLNAAQWTGMPAGGGGAEIGLTATLVAWVPATAIAAALLLWRMATLYASLAAGLGAIGWLARRRDGQFRR
ncbi:MAG: lysylphosphatidylglycerol synthase transmembrane domain-containing protein [Rhodanobacteraceae bacterium]